MDPRKPLGQRPVGGAPVGRPAQGGASRSAASGQWPPSLRAYVERCFAQCTTEAERERTEAYLKRAIEDAVRAAVLHSRDWSAVPLPDVRAGELSPVPQRPNVPGRHSAASLPPLHAAGRMPVANVACPVSVAQNSLATGKKPAPSAAHPTSVAQNSLAAGKKPATNAARPVFVAQAGPSTVSAHRPNGAPSPSAPGEHSYVRASNAPRLDGSKTGAFQSINVDVQTQRFSISGLPVTGAAAAPFLPSRSAAPGQPAYSSSDARSVANPSGALSTRHAISGLPLVPQAPSAKDGSARVRQSPNKDASRQSRSQPAGGAPGVHTGAQWTVSALPSYADSTPLDPRTKGRARMHDGGGFVLDRTPDEVRLRSPKHTRAEIDASSAKRSERAKRFERTADAREEAPLDETLAALAEDGAAWDGEAVVGTCTVLEKRYLRLTSAPHPSTVRPLPVLRRALEWVLGLWASRSATYAFVCEQLKSVRQDVTVQRIRGVFAVRVYEAHARVAIEAGDLGEYNQCHGQLRLLYAAGAESPDAALLECMPEFWAYRVLYLLLTRDGLAMAALLAATPERLARAPPVAHALSLRSALQMRDHARFFALASSAPGLGRMLLSHFLERERHAALSALLRAFRPAISVGYAAGILGCDASALPALLEAMHAGLGRCVSPDGLAIDTRLAVSVMAQRDQ